MNEEDRNLEPTDKLGESLRQMFAAKVGNEIPDFNATWSAAEDRVLASKSRIKMNSAIAASIAAVTIFFATTMFRQPAEQPDSELAAMLLVSTQWIAPSDVLMPVHSFDLYQDVPEFIEPTDLTKGLLL